MPKKLKALSLLLLVVIAVVALSGCGQSKETSTVVDIYKSTAQKFLDSGNVDSAIEVLEEGIAATNDTDLIALLAEINETTESSSKNANLDFTIYDGFWIEDVARGLDGLSLELIVDRDTMNLILTLTGSAPSYRIARFEETVNTAEISKNTVRFDFDDDCWGNAGTIELTFSEDIIKYTISNVHYTGEEGFALWGVSDSSGDLIPGEVYEEKYPEEMEGEIVSENDEYFDTSTASGILASLGMTEDEFKSSCLNLSTDSDTASGIQLADIAEYPNDYIGTFCTYYYSSGAWGHIEAESKGETDDGYFFYLDKFLRFLYKGIIIKHNKTEPTYTKTSLFLCEKRRFFMARTEKGGKVF